MDQYSTRGFARSKGLPHIGNRSYTLARHYYWRIPLPHISNERMRRRVYVSTSAELTFRYAWARQVEQTLRPVRQKAFRRRPLQRLPKCAKHADSRSRILAGRQCQLHSRTRTFAPVLATAWPPRFLANAAAAQPADPFRSRTYIGVPRSEPRTSRLNQTTLT